jgi:hypothetical protein
MIGKMMCVKAELISTRLLSKDDKDDMLNGLIPTDSLINHVKVWIENDMRDYADGNTSPYKKKTMLTGRVVYPPTI